MRTTAALCGYAQLRTYTHVHVRVRACTCVLVRAYTRVHARCVSRPLISEFMMTDAVQQREGILVIMNIDNRRYGTVLSGRTSAMQVGKLFTVLKRIVQSIGIPTYIHLCLCFVFSIIAYPPVVLCHISIFLI